MRDERFNRGVNDCFTIINNNNNNIQLYIQMTSVERVQQYYSLPSEAAEEVEDKKPPPDWPTRGSLKFENVSFAYYEGGPVVLKNLNFEIEAKEKV